MSGLQIGHYYKRVYSDGNQIIFQVLEEQTDFSVRVNIVQSKGYNHNIVAMYVTPDDALIDTGYYGEKGFSWKTTRVEEDDLVWELLG